MAPSVAAAHVSADAAAQTADQRLTADAVQAVLAAGVAFAAVLFVIARHAQGFARAHPGSAVRAVERVVNSSQILAAALSGVHAEPAVPAGHAAPVCNLAVRQLAAIGLSVWGG